MWRGGGRAWNSWPRPCVPVTFRQPRPVTEEVSVNSASGAREPRISSRSISSASLSAALLTSGDRQILVRKLTPIKNLICFQLREDCTCLRSFLDMVITDSVPRQRQNRMKGWVAGYAGFVARRCRRPIQKSSAANFSGGVRGDGRLISDGELSRLEVLRGSGSETIHDRSGGAVAGWFGNRLR